MINILFLRFLHMFYFHNNMNQDNKIKSLIIPIRLSDISKFLRNFGITV